MAAKGAHGGVTIIKKIKKGGHGGHHGGAWKVAYADFVTAMMAFFLLLWLLNVTTDVQKRGIADYFEPTITSKSNSGAGGVLGGTTMGSPGAQSVSFSKPSFEPSRAALRQPSEGDDGDEGGTAGPDKDKDDTSGGGGGPADKMTDQQMQKQLAEREEKNFEEAKTALEKALQDSPELQGLSKNLMIDETPEGLRIQLVDQDKSAMFPVGSSSMAEPAKKLMGLVEQVIQKLPNKISITGHTDSTQYAIGNRYGNWELSADRANATRREFVANGFSPDRLSRIVGTADKEPLENIDPAAPQNRRMSIVLLRDAKAIPTLKIKVPDAKK